MRSRVQLERVGVLLAQRDTAEPPASDGAPLRERAERAAYRYFGVTVRDEEVDDVLDAYSEERASRSERDASTGEPDGEAGSDGGATTGSGRGAGEPSGRG
jgi:hypothetical protein